MGKSVRVTSAILVILTLIIFGVAISKSAFWATTQEATNDTTPSAIPLIVTTGDSTATLQPDWIPVEIQPPFSDPPPSQPTGESSNDLWVDLNYGNDLNSGLNSQEGLRTIQQAAEIAQPGTTIHIMPGMYREEIVPANSGDPDRPITFVAEGGLGTVIVRGSEPSSSLTWNRLTSNYIGLPSSVDPNNIYYADLSSWELQEAPRFVVEVDDDGNILSRLMPAREPDWQVVTEWKTSEFWWFANGGTAVAGCDPRTNSNPDCDYGWRSYTQLTDTLDDIDPVGIEPGNLKTLPNLVGATLVALDTDHALYVFRRTIIEHNRTIGRVTVDENCDNGGTPGLGWGSKYYLENHPSLIDHPGEWWYDKNTGRLYIWSPTGENPAQQNLEISRRDDGVDLTKRSYVIFDGLQIDLFNQTALVIDNNSTNDFAHGNQVKNSLLQYSNKGIVLSAYVSSGHTENAIDGFLLENSEVANMDTTGFDSSFWWPDGPSPTHFTYAGVRNLVIRDNEFHHLGFNSDDRSAVGMRIFFPDHVWMVGNHIHHVAQLGVHLHMSLIDSDRYYDVPPQDIKLGVILVKDNIFEKACLNASDCAGFKMGGRNRPDNHIFRDVLITGNVFRHNFGWSYVSLQRHSNQFGDGNGFYLDYASGVNIYRNISYNNSGSGYKLACLWRDGEAVLYNNIAANNYVYGFKLTGQQECDDHGGSVDTQLVNNVIINNGMYGYQFNSSYANQYGNLVIDHNLYYNNGWDEQTDGGDIQLYRTSLPVTNMYGLDEIRANTPWETHGFEGDPFFQSYNPSDHRLYLDFWPDFSPTIDSFRLIDMGSASIPLSVFKLLILFGLDDPLCGDAFEIGTYEYKSPPSPGMDPYCRDFELKHMFLPAVVR